MQLCNLNELYSSDYRVSLAKLGLGAIFVTLNFFNTLKITDFCKLVILTVFFKI